MIDMASEAFGELWKPFVRPFTFATVSELFICTV